MHDDMAKGFGQNAAVTNTVTSNLMCEVGWFLVYVVKVMCRVLCSGLFRRAVR